MDIIEGKDILIECPNEHPVHEECLSEWIRHSPNCPLCSEPYPADLVSQSKNYIEQKEREQKKDQLTIERNEKIKNIAEKMVYIKFFNIIETLSEKKDYDDAIERLLAFEEKILTPDQKQKILFLKGKIYFLKGRYDMAIGHLFKLVKQQYDYPEAFQYLGKAYQELGLDEKAKWAFERAQ